MNPDEIEKWLEIVTDPAVEAAKKAWESENTAWKIALAAAREALAPLRELHKPVTHDSYGPEQCCYTCCGWEYGWPCLTARLIYRGDEL